MVGMLGVTDIGTYILGTIAIILLPGPNALFVLTTAARHGVRSGYRAAAGIFVGDWVLMGASAAGVASLLHALPPLFFVIKYAGAVYLAYVGGSMVVNAVRQWRHPTTQPSTGTGEMPTDTRSSARVGASDPTIGDASPIVNGRPVRRFRRALLISLLNPKAILFMISFFAQFLDPTYPRPLVTFLFLATILQICSFAFLSVLIFGGGYLAARVRGRRLLRHGFNAGVGAIFLGFGVKLATATLS